MRNKLLALGALGVCALVLIYISVAGLEKNLVYYWTPSELLARGNEAHDATIRLGGVVQKGSVDWNPETLSLKFVVAMAPDAVAAGSAVVPTGETPAPNGPSDVPVNMNASIAVESKGAPPQMFQEGMGAVVEGSYDGKTFRADRVMVKHSNEYRAPEAGEKPQEMYKTLINDDAE